MTDRNDASAESKAETDRWTSDSETVERVDETTQSTTGIGTPGAWHGAEHDLAQHEDIVRRTGEARDYTPRRYEQPAEDDPITPAQDSSDSSLDTKI